MGNQKTIKNKEEDGYWSLDPGGCRLWGRPQESEWRTSKGNRIQTESRIQMSIISCQENLTKFERLTTYH
ncbi:unnamed protein product [Ambrosiozyma monospora]|uniref:Unnamed protein product n=1 Tax=Ambrosiozyma monospora TaxID=43982 RepID=A0A9W6YYT0_AMBMO|nr:unnamed protein product [Ambrosiozyma monospora]